MSDEVGPCSQECMASINETLEATLGEVVQDIFFDSEEYQEERRTLLIVFVFVALYMVVSGIVFFVMAVNTCLRENGKKPICGCVCVEDQEAYCAEIYAEGEVDDSESETEVDCVADEGPSAQAGENLSSRSGSALPKQPTSEKSKAQAEVNLSLRSNSALPKQPTSEKSKVGEVEPVTKTPQVGEGAPVTETLQVKIEMQTVETEAPISEVHTEDMKETENDQEANKNHEEYDDYGYPVESEHAAGSEHPQSRS